MKSSGTPIDRTPEILLGRYRTDGRPEDLAALFDATSPELFRLALHLCPDAATAEDVLQETFLVVLERASAWDPSRPVMPWLTGILKNEALMARRRAARRPDPRRLDGPVVTDDPLLAAADAEEKARLEKAMQALPEPYRGVALLRWRYGLEPSAIADVKGVPPGTVWSWLHRAVRKLKVEMGAMPALLLAFRPERGLDTVRSAVLRRAAAKTLATGAAAGATASIASFTLGGLLMSTKGLAAAAVVLVLCWTGWFMFGSPPKPVDARLQTFVGAEPSYRPATARPSVSGSVPTAAPAGPAAEGASPGPSATAPGDRPLIVGPVASRGTQTLRVFVETESGAAVEGVRVLLRKQDERDICKFTNSLGFTLYRGLGPEMYQLQIGDYGEEMEGLTPPPMENVVPSGQTIRLVLGEAAEVRGTLVDDAGNPLPRMGIEVYREVAGSPPAPVWAVFERGIFMSDDNGEFLVKKAPRGVPLTFIVSGARMPPRDPGEDPRERLVSEQTSLRAEFKGIVAPASGVRIVATKQLLDRTLDILVLDADGRPVPYVRVTLSWPLHAAITRADGRVRFDELGADLATVMIFPEGAPGMAEDAVPPSSVEVKPAGQTVTLQFTHGAFLGGRVYLPDGSLAAGAEVRCFAGSGFEGIVSCRPVRTDAEGRFRAAVPKDRKVGLSARITREDGTILSSLIEKADPANGDLEIRLSPLPR